MSFPSLAKTELMFVFALLFIAAVLALPHWLRTRASSSTTADPHVSATTSAR